MKKSYVLLPLFLLLSSCGSEPVVHTHTFSEKWSCNEACHFHEASCDHKELTKDLANHVDNDKDGKCDVCDYQIVVDTDLVHITKQPGEVYVKYPDAATMSVEVDHPEEVYYYQWQYCIGEDFEGKPRYRDVEGMAGRSDVLEIQSIRQRAGDFMVFRCEIGLMDGGPIFSEQGRFIVSNKTEDIDCAYVGEYAVKAGEKLDLFDTPYGEGTISLNETGDEYTFDNVNMNYKYPYTTRSFFENAFTIDSDTNKHSVITIKLIGDNVLIDPYWDYANNAGEDLIFTFFSSTATKASLNIVGDGTLSLKGGSRAIYSHGPLNINAPIDIESFHYRLSNGINCADDITFEEKAKITGSVGGYGVSASSLGSVYLNEGASINLEVYPGKVLNGMTNIYGISAANFLIIEKASIDLKFFVDTNIYSVDEENLLSLIGLLSHNSVIEINNSTVNIEINTSGEVIDDEFVYINSVCGIKGPGVGLKESTVNIDITAKDADSVYGVMGQSIQIIKSSKITIKQVGGLEKYGIFSNTNEVNDGVKIRNSSVSVNTLYGENLDNKLKICSFGIATILYAFELDSLSSITINCNNDGVALGVIYATGQKVPVTPYESGFDGEALKIDGFKVKELSEINVNSFKTGSKYQYYETFANKVDHSPLSSLTLVSKD